MHERQCTLCGMIFDVDQPIDVNSFVCYYCWPTSPIPGHAVADAG